MLRSTDLCSEGSVTLQIIYQYINVHGTITNRSLPMFTILTCVTLLRIILPILPIFKAPSTPLTFKYNSIYIV